MIAVVVATGREYEALAGVLPKGVVLYRSGTGKVNAAMAATIAVWCLGPVDAVVNAGLAGAVSPDVRLGAAYAVERAAQFDVDLSDVDGGDAWTVDGRTSQFFDLGAVPGLPSANVGTSDRFAVSRNDAAVLRKAGCGLVDMECAAIAQVCEKTGTPLYAVKVASDRNDPGEYNANADKRLAALADAVKMAVAAAGRNCGCFCGEDVV